MNNRYNRKPEADETAPKKRKKFNLFDAIYERSEKRRKEIDYDPNHKRDFRYFFKMLSMNFSNIFYINLMAVLASFPIFILILVFSENLHIRMVQPAGPLFAPIYGAQMLGAVNPMTMAMHGLYSIPGTVAIWTPIAKALLIVGIVLLAIVFGPVCTATAYLFRNMVKGEPLFLFTDFKYAIKRNLKQEFIVGILDFAFLGLLAYDIYFFYLNITGTLTGIFFYMSLVFACIYFVMRFYLYIMMVTFDLSIFKLIKNAFIFSILGFKRNFLGFFGIVLVIGLNVLIAIVYMPIGIVLPFIITAGLCMYIAAYTAWPKIKEIMVDPYYNEDGTPIQPAKKEQ